MVSYIYWYMKKVIKQILNESKQQYFIETVVNDMLNKTSIEGHIDKFGIYAPYYNTPMNFIGAFVAAQALNAPPPLADPSSLVTIMLPISVADAKANACS